MNEYRKMGFMLERVWHYALELEQRCVAESEYNDISINNLHILEVIYRIDIKSMSRIAKVMRVTVGTLTIAVNGLVKKGYVTREKSEKDRRVVLLALTDKGRAALSVHTCVMDDICDIIESELSMEKCEDLNKILEDIYRRLISRLDGINAEDHLASLNCLQKN